MAATQPYDFLDEGLPVYQELAIWSESLDPTALRRSLASASHRDWQRDRKAEAGRISEDDRVQFLMFSGQWGAGTESILIILHVDAGRWRVTNVITPDRNGTLTHERYNKYLQDFRDAIPARLEAQGVCSEITPLTESLSINHWVGDPATKLLKDFARTTTKSSPTMHPSDAARWNAFLIAGCPFQKSDAIEYLERWLWEIAGFPESVARKLAIKAEEADSLIRSQREHG